MPFKDYYALLGLPANAPLQDIKTAYRKLSKKFHPDHNPGDKYFEDRFKDIQEAYNTLGDEYRRRIYDFNYRHTNLRQLEEDIKEKEVFKSDKPIEWKCRNCGYIHYGKEAPDQCPVCKHPQSYYERRCKNY